jgi:CubicO group peptidase (beta-lactamase class C family)
MAFTLIGYLVQKFSGMPYKQYIQERIFTPLEMTSTAFEPRPDMEERLSIPYTVDERRARRWNCSIEGISVARGPGLRHGR